MCIFDILGTVYVNNEDTSVRRYGDMLVLELIDTTVMVFRIRKRFFNRYDLYIMDSKVFSVHGSRARITFGYVRDGRLGVRYDMYVGSDYIGGHIVAGIRITVGEKVFLEEEVYEWAIENGAILPSCCIYTISDEIVEHGCGLVRRSNMFLIRFPNGFVFPILRVDDELRIVCESIVCDSINFITLAVRVLECQSDCVSFRVVVFDGSRMAVLDDIIYDSCGVHYSDKTLSPRQIAKLLLLG